MSVQDKVNDVLLTFAKEVGQAILAGNYELVSRSGHITCIKACDETLDIWTSSGSSYLRCYRLHMDGDTHRLYFPEHRFAHAEACHIQLMRRTENEIEVAADALRKQISNAESKLAELYTPSEASIPSGPCPLLEETDVDSF